MKKQKNKNKITIGGNFPIPGKAPATVVITQNKRFGIDISSLITAINSAENIDFSRRSRLYDLYTDILIDAHLGSVMDKRVRAVTSAPIEFCKDNKPVDEINEQLESPWFYNLLKDIMDARFWGFSLFQFYKEGEWINYDLIPRKHVDPIRELILRRQTDITGLPWQDFSDLVFVGKSNDLGILASCAPWVIYKRGSTGDWAELGEIFGRPIREYIYDSSDEETRNRLLDDAQEEGGAGVFIHPRDSELIIKECNLSGSNNLHESFNQYADNEMSKKVLGNTLTTQASDTGTQALGTVHKEVEEGIYNDDLKFVLNVLNYDLFETFTNLGMNVQGGKFRVAKPNAAKNITPKERAEILASLKTNFDLPVDDDYIYEQFGIDKPTNYDSIKASLQEEKEARAMLAAAIKDEPQEEEEKEDPDNDDDKQPDNTPKDKKKKSFLNRLKSFFGLAPQKGALEW